MPFWEMLLIGLLGNLGEDMLLCVTIEFLHVNGPVLNLAIICNMLRPVTFSK